METFTDYLARDRRLGVLLLLQESLAHRLNHRVITVGLEHLGHSSNRAMIIEDLRLLAKEKLVNLSHPEDGPTVVELTDRGLDVARGCLIVESVSTPPLDH